MGFFFISWIAHHQRLWNDVPYQLMPNRSRPLNYMYWSFRPKLNFLTRSYLLDDWFFCIRFDKNNTFGIWCHKIDMYSITESNILYHNMCKNTSFTVSLLLLMIPNLIGLPIILTILSWNMHMHLLFLLKEVKLCIPSDFSIISMYMIKAKCFALLNTHN